MRMSAILCKDTGWLFSEEAFLIYAACMYRPSFEGYRARMKQYISSPSTKVFVWEERGEKTGIIVLGQSGPAAQILGIAVSDAHRRRGTGRRMIHQVMASERLERIEAQTDDDAIGFYRRCGFDEERMVIDYADGPTVRYNCSLHINVQSFKF